MRILSKGEIIEVGDTIVTSNMYVHKYKISRVTKTLAISKRERDGYEYRFKREVSYNMSHPSTKWNTTDYTVYRND